MSYVMGTDPDWEAYQEDLADEQMLRDEMQTPEPPDPPETPEERAHAEWVSQVEREIDADEKPSLCVQCRGSGRTSCKFPTECENEAF